MNRFSKENFYKLSSNQGAIKRLLEFINANPDDKKIINDLNRFFNIQMFKPLGSGMNADVFQINNSQVLRISKELPRPLPKDIRINPRLGFLKVNGYYIEMFPLLDIPKGYLNQKETEPIAESLKQKYPEAWDMHNENFGLDPKTKEIKLLDPGCMVDQDKDDELYFESEFMRLQTQFKSLLDAVKAYPLNIRYIPEEYQTEDIVLTVIDEEPDLIRFVKNKTEKACIKAVQADPSLLRYIFNPSFNVCLEAVKTKVKLGRRGLMDDVPGRFQEKIKEMLNL